MKTSFSPLFIAGALLLLASCGGTKGEAESLDVPTNLPEICRGIDFVAQPDMREECGVRVSRYKSYKNIPQQRYLIYPKDASLVKTSDKVELRLPNTLPIYLDSATAAGIEFSQEHRLQSIKNTMEYKELFPAGAERIKMFRMVLPKDVGEASTLCFRVPDKKGNERTRSVAMGNQIESMTCADFDLLVAKYVR
jgi:hypothetical protein